MGRLLALLKQTKPRTEAEAPPGPHIPALQQPPPFQLPFHMQEALGAGTRQKKGLLTYSAGPKDNGDKLATTLLKRRKMQGVYRSKKMVQV